MSNEKREKLINYINLWVSENGYEDPNDGRYIMPISFNVAALHKKLLEI